MMRREELLVREAWNFEDAAVRHAIELWEHGARNSRLFRPASASPPTQDSEAQRSLERGKKLRSTAPTDRARESRRQKTLPQAVDVLKMIRPNSHLSKNYEKKERSV